MEKDRPSGDDSEHKQPSKTINAKAQQKKRADTRRKKMALQLTKDTTTRNTIIGILDRNRVVENKIKSATGAPEMSNDATAGSLNDASVATFLKTLDNKELRDFIHVRKFTTETFQTSTLTGNIGKLNKTLFKHQTAQSIEESCSDESPCLVWLAWKLRSEPIVLQIPPEPILIAPTVPAFNVVYAGPQLSKRASEYLSNTTWVEVWKRIVKGVSSIAITDEMMNTADKLAESMAARLAIHIDDRVDSSRHNHWTLQFTRDNLPPMAAAMCLVGHIVDDIETYGIDECLLKLPMEEMFQVVSGNIGKLEGCYLYYDPKKMKWIRSGKTSGDGEDACFFGRGNKHSKNAASLDEQRLHPFYRHYPVKSSGNLGAPSGYFDNLVMYVGMAYDTSPPNDLSPLCSADESLLVWSEQTISELKLKSKGDNLERLQLDAVAYLWELCYDLLLNSSHNVSVSPGFEAFGLRVNRKRKRSDE